MEMEPYIPRFSTRFKKDLKLMKKRGKDVELLKIALSILLEKESLPHTYKDHALIGEWTGCRDVHIEFDWVLIYEIDEEENSITFWRTGTHSDLFG